MKQNDLSDVTYKLPPQNYENIFSVYEDEESGFYFYNLLRSVNFPEEIDPTQHKLYTAVHNDTWPLIAWKVYRNVKLWWVIVGVNQIINPTVQPTPGTKLKIIKAEVVRGMLNLVRSE